MPHRCKLIAAADSESVSPVLLAKDFCSACDLFSDAVCIAECPRQTVRNRMCHEYIDTFRIRGFRWDENLILSSELAKPSHKIIKGIIIPFNSQQEIISRCILSPDNVMHGLFRTPHCLNSILYWDSHQVHRLVVKPPCTPQDEIFRRFYSKRKPRSNLITLNALFPVLLVEIMHTGIEGKFRMKLPLILQKCIEFTPVAVNISKN